MKTKMFVVIIALTVLWQACILGLAYMVYISGFPVLTETLLCAGLVVVSIAGQALMSSWHDKWREREEFKYEMNKYGQRL